MDTILSPNGVIYVRNGSENLLFVLCKNSRKIFGSMWIIITLFWSLSGSLSMLTVYFYYSRRRVHCPKETYFEKDVIAHRLDWTVKIFATATSAPVFAGLRAATRAADVEIFEYGAGDDEIAANIEGFPTMAIVITFMGLVLPTTFEE